MRRIALWAFVYGLTIGTAFSKNIPFPGFPLDRIGHYLDPATGKIGQWCAKGEVVFKRHAELTTKLHVDKSAQHLYNNVHGKLGHSVNLGLIGHKKSVEFLGSYSANSQATSIVYEIDAQHGVFKMRSPVLVNPSQCSDGYVDSASVGSKLLIGMMASFDSEEEYQKFIVTSKISAMFGLKTSKKTEVREFKKALGRGYVKVSRLLVGATSLALEKLEPEMVCDAESIEQCLDLAQSFLTVFTKSGAFYAAVNEDISNNQYFVQTVNISD